MLFIDHKISLHEATVESFHWYNDDSLKLKLSYIDDSDITKYINIDIYKVCYLFIDGNLIKKNDLNNYEDGEILHYSLTIDKINLIIEWNDFKKNLSKIKSYEIKCKEVRLN